jgi:hypothetical protein
MSRDISYLVLHNLPWVIGLVGLVGILWRLGRIIEVLEQIRDQPREAPTGTERPKRITVPGLND